jgi:hypothetical protein
MNLFRVIPRLCPTHRRGDVKCSFRIHGGNNVACLMYWIHRSAPSECLYLVVRQVSFQLTRRVLCAAWVEYYGPRGTNGSVLAFLFLHGSDLQNVRERIGQIPFLRTFGFVSDFISIPWRLSGRDASMTGWLIVPFPGELGLIC